MKRRILQFIGTGLFITVFTTAALYLFEGWDLMEKWETIVVVLVVTWILLYVFSFHQDKKWVKKFMKWCARHQD
ncbi:MAG: hypothetical protein IIA72_22085 [Proteobacteria bacterium]|nr:hypothetical protein [Pseudomonadota bacterium]